MKEVFLKSFNEATIKLSKAEIVCLLKVLSDCKIKSFMFDYSFVPTERLYYKILTQIAKQ